MIARLCQDSNVNVNGLFDTGRKYSKAALHAAAKNGHLEVYQELVRRGANIEVQSANGFRPIHFAVEMGHLKIVEDLVKRHADVNLSYSDEVTLLYKAVHREHLEIANLLQEHGAIVDAVGATRCLPKALARQHTEIVELLVSHGADINDQDLHPLGIATRSKQLNNVKFLTEQGANLDAKDGSGYTPAQIAATVGWLEGLKFFLENFGIEPNLDWKGAAFAIFMNSKDPEGTATTIEYLIDRGLIHIDSRDSDGAPLLYRAWELGQTRTVEVLLAETANPVARSRAGETRWEIAMRAGKQWRVSKIKEFASNLRAGPRSKRFCETQLSPCGGPERMTTLVGTKIFPKLKFKHTKETHNCWAWLNIRTTEVGHPIPAEENIN